MIKLKEFFKKERIIIAFVSDIVVLSILFLTIGINLSVKKINNGLQVMTPEQTVQKYFEYWQQKTRSACLV